MSLRALGTATALCTITAVVAIAGRGTLVAPPIGHPATLLLWWRSVGPLVGVFSLVRVAVIASGAYCVLLLGLVAAAGLMAGEQGSRLVARTHLWGVRRALTLALGASTAGVLFAGCASTGGRATPTPRPVLTYVGASSPASAPSSHRGSASDPQTVARPRTIPRERPAAHRPAVALPSLPDAVWTVQPGDNLWSIASMTLESRLGRAASDQEIGAYWQAVIEINLQRLPVPSDPGLLFAGDVIELPPVGVDQRI
jgi:hypothetical protein